MTKTTNYDQNTDNKPFFSLDRDDMPDLSFDHEDSTEGYESGCDSNFFDDVEQAFIGKAVFFDDNNSIISLTGDDLLHEEEQYEEVPMNTIPLLSADISTIAIKNSVSEASEEIEAASSKTDMDDDRKTAAKNSQYGGTQPVVLQPEGNVEKKLAPKLPMSSNNLSNEKIVRWLGKQHPLLADSFAQEFNLSTAILHGSSVLPNPDQLLLTPQVKRGNKRYHVQSKGMS